MFVSMNIAIIGTGHSGDDYAISFAMTGHEVFMAWKEGDNASKSSNALLLDNVHACSIEEAADIADLIIVTSTPKDVREVAYWLGDARHKVIIDATANLFVPEKEAMTTTYALQSITGSAHVIKIFSTRGYEQILRPLFKGDKVELLLAGESKKAKEVMKILAPDMGFITYYDLGGSDTIPLFDELAKCWRNLASAQNLFPNTNTHLA